MQHDSYGDDVNFCATRTEIHRHPGNRHARAVPDRNGPVFDSRRAPNLISLRSGVSNTGEAGLHSSGQVTLFDGRLRLISSRVQVTSRV